MRIAHIVRSEGKPDPFVLRHTFRHFTHHILQITHATANALFGIGTIRNAEALRGILVNIIMPRTPVGEVACASQCDS